MSFTKVSRAPVCAEVAGANAPVRTLLHCRMCVRVPLSPSIRVGLLLVGEMAFAFQLLSGLAQLEGKVGSYGNVPDWNSTPP